VSKNTATSPSPEDLRDRIERNLERVQGYLDILQKEINDPDRSSGGGSRKEWQQQAEKLDTSLTELKGILIKGSGEQTLD